MESEIRWPFSVEGFFPTTGKGTAVDLGGPMEVGAYYDYWTFFSSLDDLTAVVRTRAGAGSPLQVVIGGSVCEPPTDLQEEDQWRLIAWRHLTQYSGVVGIHRWSWRPALVVMATARICRCGKATIFEGTDGAPIGATYLGSYGPAYWFTVGVKSHTHREGTVDEVLDVANLLIKEEIAHISAAVTPG